MNRAQAQSGTPYAMHWDLHMQALKAIIDVLRPHLMQRPDGAPELAAASAG